MENLKLVKEQKQQIEDLERQIEILEEKLHSAEEVNRSKSRFLSNMSHECDHGYDVYWFVTY